jgi:hypothetical protein
MLHTVITLHPFLYWPGILALLVAIPTVAYRLGYASQAPAAGQQHYTSIVLRFRPFTHRLDVRMANLRLSAEIQANVRQIVAHLEVSVS